MSATTSITVCSTETRLAVGDSVSLTNAIPIQSDILLSLQDCDYQLADEGLIVMLPDENKVQAACPHPWYLQQAALNPGAYFHPVLILRQVGDIVFAAPITSFGEKTLHEKYSNASKAAWDRISQSFIVIRRKESATVDINTIGQLEHSGRDLQKQSYVNLNHGFWMPRHCLETFRGGERKLTATSLKTAQRAFGRAESHRRVNGLSSRVPEAKAARQLPTPPPSPPAMGRQGSWRPEAPVFKPLSLPMSSTPFGQKRQRSESPVKANKARNLDAPWR
jgi:hypothetical protein